MKTMKFKTNINCGGCIANVTPSLNQVKGIKKWEVDITNPQKTLTVEAEELSEAEVVQVIKKAGYNAERIDN